MPRRSQQVHGLLMSAIVADAKIALGTADIGRPRPPNEGSFRSLARSAERTEPVQT